MDGEVIDLVALRSPLPKVKFASGRVLQVMEATALTERLRREVAADPANEQKVRAVLANIIPDATDEDWESCTSEDVERIYEVALRKTTRALGIVEARRKNGDAGNAETVTRRRSRSRRSSPTTTSDTSAPA